MTQITIPIIGMSCVNCANAIERSTQQLAGVDTIQINFGNEKATITYDAAIITTTVLIQHIRELGYEIPIATLELPLIGLSCVNCATAVEHVLQQNIAGIITATVNFATEKALIHYIPGATTQGEMVKAIEQAGYGVVQATHDLVDAEKLARQREVQQQTHYLWVGVFFTLPLFIFSMLRDFELIGLWSHAIWVNYLFWGLATPVQFYVGLDYYIGGYKSLRHGSANMDVLVALGSSVAYFYSIFILFGGLEGHVYFETSAAIITLIKIGKLLEVRAKGKTSEAIKALIGLQAKTALIERNGIEMSMPIEQVEVGDIVIVRAGEKIPVDGLVIMGESAVDESLLTGESLAIDKVKGDQVMAATLNRQGLLKIAATQVGNKTMLAQIIHLVETAQGSKAPIQALADRVSAIFVPTVIIIAALTFAIWLMSGAEFSHALVRMVAVLVIACPCALGLATPTAMVVSMGNAARQGILFRNSTALQQAHQLQTVVLDKTGTITQGIPTLTDIINLTDLTENVLLQQVASAERGSTHPLAQAMIKAAQQRQLTLIEPEQFNTMSGQGIQAIVNNKQFVIANPRWLQTNQIDMSAVESQIVALQNQAKTVMCVVIEGKISAILGIADQVKVEAREAITALKQLGLNIVMLTGDNQVTAHAIAQSVGIETVLAEVLPHEKAQHIKQLQQQGLKVAMVGDGINDAPALAQADVGIAMGSGADVAMETADITLIKGNLFGVRNAIVLSQSTMRIIKQNLFWAFAYNVILIPLAAGILAIFPLLPIYLRELHPIAAALAMALSSVTVVTNSLRLRQK